jgi:hypothetical protein
MKMSGMKMSGKTMMPLKEFAAAAGIPYTTMIRWVKADRIKGAIFVETPIGGYWMAPKEALKTLERPKIGRPPKAASQEAANKRRR